LLGSPPLIKVPSELPKGSPSAIQAIDTAVVGQYIAEGQVRGLTQVGDEWEWQLAPGNAGGSAYGVDPGIQNAESHRILIVGVFLGVAGSSFVALILDWELFRRPRGRHLPGANQAPRKA
jgi:hypothetical protein